MMNLNAQRRSMQIVVFLLTAVITSTAAPIFAADSSKNDDTRTSSSVAALDGVEEAKTVFLVKKDSPASTAGFLKAIRGTHQSILDEGVQSNVVVVFLGPAVQYLSTEPGADLAEKHGDSLQSIVKTVAALKELGVRMEVCGAATKHFGVDNSTLLKEMDLVSNGFISLIGWQSQGYVPMTF